MKPGIVCLTCLVYLLLLVSIAHVLLCLVKSSHALKKTVLYCPATDTWADVITANEINGRATVSSMGREPLTPP